MLSASFGLQGAAAEVVGTGVRSFAFSAGGLQAESSSSSILQFGTTVVLTSTWVQLSTIPWPFSRSRPRDDRVLAILLFMIGAFIARLLLCVTRSAATLGIGTGYVTLSFVHVQMIKLNSGDRLRALILVLWMACPADLIEEKGDPEKAVESNQIMMTRSNDSMATL